MLALHLIVRRLPVLWGARQGIITFVLQIRAMKSRETEFAPQVALLPMATQACL